MQKEMNELTILACKNWNVNGESASDATWKLLEAKLIPNNITFNGLMSHIGNALSTDYLHNKKVYNKIPLAQAQAFLSK